VAGHHVQTHGRCEISSWEIAKLLYSGLNELPDETGAEGALSGHCAGADGLGGEGLSHGASARPGGLETIILIAMRPTNLEDGIRNIVAADPRYPAEAYLFVQEALKHTQRALGRTKLDQKHVGGKELLEGIRLFALKTFGPMVPTMLTEWGIHSCEDFGEIVFNMIEYHVASKTTIARTPFASRLSLPRPCPARAKRMKPNWPWEIETNHTLNA
jgi:uncharacterized repeat protein (TIGR04138 family)